MAFYYVNVNTQSTKKHEVHTENCTFLPEENQRERLGYFLDCNDALMEAEKYFKDVDGCRFCSYKCHNR